MKLEVLVSAMHQENFDLVKKLNLKTDAIIINQCDKYDYVELEINKNKIKMISNKQRGLSKSRNEALSNSSGDICLLCDDDVRYEDNYEKIILDAFKELPEADIIVFETNMLNYKGKVARKKTLKIKKAPFYRTYGSVRLAFRTSSIKKSNVWFDVNFGAGTENGAGEESIFLKDLREKGLKVYLHPSIIAEVDYSDSTWFEGYNEQFFKNIGAYLARNHSKLKNLYKYYYYFKFRNVTNVSIVNSINQGIKRY